MNQCLSVRHWYGGGVIEGDDRRGCRCDHDEGHTGKHLHVTCSLEWGPGNENFTNKVVAARVHALERIQGRQTTLQVLRERAGLTQEKMGLLIGYGQSTVARWERGDELMPDHARPVVVRILRQSFSEMPLLADGDLDASWDDTLLSWDRRSRATPPVPPSAGR